MKKKSIFFQIQLNFFNKPLFEGLPTDYICFYVEYSPNESLTRIEKRMITFWTGLCLNMLRI